ncbi:MAG: LysR family transcriptional regulator [Myxococcota bacterium]
MDRITVLRAFVRLVEKRSFTAVADELRVKQSTVSKWLGRLEDDLGVQLLDRTTRSQRVTEAGQRFYDHANIVLNSYDNAVADLRQADPTLRGRIRMSLPVVFGRRFVVPQVTTFLQEHPHVELELIFSDRYVRIVEEGYDLALRVGIPVDSTLRAHPLGGSGRRLVASPTYLARHPMPNTPQDLEAHQCLVHTELSTRAAWSFTRDGKTHRVSVGGRISANHSEASLVMAKAGLGVCLLASWLVDEDIASGSLVQLLADYEPPGARIQAITPPGRHVPPRVRALIEHLRSGFAGTTLTNARRRN